MRAIWSGSISFGLVNIPVKLYTAVTESGGLDLHMLHASDNAPIRYARICTKEGTEVPYQEIVRGYEYAPDHFVQVLPEDFAAADPKKTGSVEIIEFIHDDELDLRYLERPFYLESDGSTADRAYALFGAALKQTGLLAVARFVLREREHLALIRPAGRALVLYQMRFPDDIKPARGLRLPDAKPAAAELKLAISLIEKQTHAFAPEDFHDTYIEKLRKRITAKLKKLPAPVKPRNASAKSAPPVADLITALKASLEHEITAPDTTRESRR